MVPSIGQYTISESVSMNHAHDLHFVNMWKQADTVKLLFPVALHCPLTCLHKESDNDDASARVAFLGCVDEQ